jgi:hypothetical protein
VNKVGSSDYGYAEFSEVLKKIDTILQEECHISPSPWRLNEENKWPFGLQIGDKNDCRVVSSDRSAYSTSHKSLSDVYVCAGFSGGDRSACIAANKTQLANHKAISYTPEAIKGIIAYLWFATKLVPMSLLASDGMDLPFQHLVTIVEASTGQLWAWWAKRLAE